MLKHSSMTMDDLPSGLQPPFTDGNLRKLPFAKLKPNTILNDVYIQGKICTKWQQQPYKNSHLLKIIIQDVVGGKDRLGKEKLSVFILGDYTKQFETATVGDYVYMTCMSVEPAPNEQCRIVVEDSEQNRPCIQIVCGRSRSVISNSDVNSRPKDSIQTNGKMLKEYVYTRLVDLQPGTTANVWGVVRYFTEPSRTKGTGYHQLISIVDPSLDVEHAKLMCQLFADDEADLPGVTETGQIVRFHRLKITSFNRKLQGNFRPGSSWLVFDGHQGARLEPKAASSASFTFTDIDQVIYKELCRWWDYEGTEDIVAGHIDNPASINTVEPAPSTSATVTPAASSTVGEQRSSPRKPSGSDGQRSSPRKPSGSDGQRSSPRKPSGSDGQRSSPRKPSGSDGQRSSPRKPSGSDGQRSSPRKPSVLASSSTSAQQRISPRRQDQQMEPSASTSGVVKASVSNQLHQRETPRSAFGNTAPTNQPQAYQYTSLKDLRAEQITNVWGVVTFVRAPKKTRGMDYVQMVSIVDPSGEDKEDKLKCLLFERGEGCLPSMAEVGQILRLHRLKITSYGGQLQGQRSPGFSWVLFDGHHGAVLTPVATSSKKFTLQEHDKQKIEELRLWAAKNHLLPEDSATRLCDIREGDYFDIVCQVVAKCRVDDSCFLLRVWDGTQAVVPLHEVDTWSAGDDVVVDAGLAAKAAGYIVDLCVFDNHCTVAACLDVGDIVKFINVHAMRHKVVENLSSTCTVVPSAELCLHGGMAFGRTLKLLHPTEDKEAKDLKKKLDEVVPLEPLQEGPVAGPSRISPAATSPKGSATSKTGPSTSKEQHSNARDQPTTSNVQPATSQIQSTASPRRPATCLRQSTANPTPPDRTTTPTSLPTVLTLSVSHPPEGPLLPSPAKRPLSESSEESSPSKTVKRSRTSLGCSPHRYDTRSTRTPVKQKVTDNNQSTPSTRSSTWRTSEELRCMQQSATVITAHHHMDVSSLKDVIEHSVPYKFRVRVHLLDYKPKDLSEHEHKRLFCPQCNFMCRHSSGRAAKDKCPSCGITEKTDQGRVLEQVWVFEFMLVDESGCLIAELWGKDAEVFFSGACATPVKPSTPGDHMIQQVLTGLLGEAVGMSPEHTSKERPWMECCILSHTADGQTCYQIFDTMLSATDD